MKNWLIRTRQRQILGPISKEKVVELLTKNLLAAEDEICSGCGYWFYVKEKNLVDKYIYSDIKQPFNPISEAKDILELSESEKISPESEENENQTQMTAIFDLKSLQPPTKTIPASHETESPISDEAFADERFPDPQELDYPDLAPGKTEANANSQTDALDVKKKIVNSNKLSGDQEKEKIAEKNISQSAAKLKEKKPARKKVSLAKAATPQNIQSGKEHIEGHPAKNDRYLFLVMGILGAIVILALYYYKKVLNKPLPFTSMVTSGKNETKREQNFIWEIFEIHPAMAQIFESRPQGRINNFPEIEPLQSQFGLIEIKYDLFGFKISNMSSKTDITECPKEWKLADSLFVLSLKRDAAVKWSQFLKECKPTGIAYQTSSALFEYIASGRPFGEQLTDVRVSQSLKADIKKMLSKKKSLSTGHELLFYLENANRQIQDLDDSASAILEEDEILQGLNAKGNFLTISLVTCAFALKHGNQAWAKNNLFKLFNLGPFELLFNRLFVSEEEKLQLNQEIYKMLKYIGSKISDDRIFYLLLAKLQSMDTSGSITRLLEDGRYNKSLEEIRKMARGHFLGDVIPVFFTEIFLRRSTELEALKYLSKFSESQFSDWEKLKILIFLSASKSRSVFKNEFKKAPVKSEFYIRNVILYLESNGVLGLNDKEVLIPESGVSFQYQRNLYNEMLKEGESVEFAIYKLIKLGDVDPLIFWWAWALNNNSSGRP